MEDWKKVLVKLGKAQDRSERERKKERENISEHQRAMKAEIEFLRDFIKRKF